MRYCINSAALLFIPKEKMKEKGYPVKRAVVYETPNNCAAYRETEEETEAVWL